MEQEVEEKGEQWGEGNKSTMEHLVKSMCSNVLKHTQVYVHDTITCVYWIPCDQDGLSIDLETISSIIS
jgi:hypothetical protein